MEEEEYAGRIGLTSPTKQTPLTTLYSKVGAPSVPPPPPPPPPPNHTHTHTHTHPPVPPPPPPIPPQTGHTHEGHNPLCAGYKVTTMAVIHTQHGGGKLQAGFIPGGQPVSHSRLLLRCFVCPEQPHRHCHPLPPSLPPPPHPRAKPGPAGGFRNEDYGDERRCSESETRAGILFLRGRQPAVDVLPSG